MEINQDRIILNYDKYNAYNIIKIIMHILNMDKLKVILPRRRAVSGLSWTLNIE